MGSKPQVLRKRRFIAEDVEFMEGKMERWKKRWGMEMEEGMDLVDSLSGVNFH